MPNFPIFINPNNYFVKKLKNKTKMKLKTERKQIKIKMTQKIILLLIVFTTAAKGGSVDLYSFSTNSHFFYTYT
jgi:hypothetical protein